MTNAGPQRMCHFSGPIVCVPQDTLLVKVLLPLDTAFLIRVAKINCPIPSPLQFWMWAAKGASPKHWVLPTLVCTLEEALKWIRGVSGGAAPPGVTLLFCRIQLHPTDLGLNKQNKVRAPRASLRPASVFSAEQQGGGKAGALFCQRQRKNPPSHCAADLASWLNKGDEIGCFSSSKESPGKPTSPLAPQRTPQCVAFNFQIGQCSF